MSDLISRSKVIAVLEKLEEHSLTGKMDISNAIYLLENQPTAYDVDKVIEEFKTDTSVKLYGSLNNGNYMIPIDRAVEIVKHGGVSNDMCEWKSDCHLENDNPAEWLISPHNPKRIFSTDIIYCPYCGKKIKVVE